MWCISWAKTPSVSCQLSGKKLAKFTPNAELFKQHAPNDRRLRDSIEVAQRILNGLTSLESQLQKLKATSRTPAKNMPKKKSTQSDAQRTSKALFDIKLCPSMSACDQSTRMIPEPPLPEPIEPSCSPSTQLELIHQIDSLQVNESNVTELLEGGLLDKLKRLPEEKASRYRRFMKKILLQKYFSKKTEHRRKIVVADRKPRAKPIHKPRNKPEVARAPQEIEYLCVRRLYSILKVYNVERQRAKALSVQLVKKLQEEATPGSKQFIGAFGSLLSAIKSTSPSVQLADQLSAQLSIDTKLPQDEQTCDSKTKHFYETSSSVF